MLIEKGGGTGPTKPWQPLGSETEKVPNPILTNLLEKDKC